MPGQKNDESLQDMSVEKLGFVSIDRALTFKRSAVKFLIANLLR